MRRTALLPALLLGLLATSVAAARTAPNPDGRARLDAASGRIVAPGRAGVPARVTPAGARAAGFVPSPLPANATLLDSTWYDLQDMGSLGTRIVCGPDGAIHLSYEKDFCELDPAGCPPDRTRPIPDPFRGMGYRYRSPAGAWTDFGKVQDPDLRQPCCPTELFGGFGAMTLAPSGRVAVAQHMNEDGCDLRGNVYLQDAPGAATWAGYLTPINSPSYLFPQVAASPGGSFTVLGEVPVGGLYDETQSIAISHVPAAKIGVPFVCPVGWQGGAWTTFAPTALFRDGRPAFPHIAVSANGRVGIAVGDFGGNVYLIESSDGTFAPATRTIRNLTNTTDAQVTVADSTSTEYRAYVNVHLAYNDTTPNVVWSELQARRVGGLVRFYDHRSRIRHWDPVHGVTTVRQVQAGEADRFDDVDQDLAGPLPGFNTLAVDWPQVGFSPDGSETYVTWLRASDAEIDPTADMGLPGIVTGVAFMDIAASVRVGAGGWSPAQNLTQTPLGDERFAALAARNPGGRAHMVFQTSALSQAGNVVIGDRGTTPGDVLRRIAYLETPLAGSTVSVEDAPRAAMVSLHAFPNPARGRVSFALRGAGRGPSFVDVYSVGGRRVARVAVTGGQAVWEGRDAEGRRLPSGVYWARTDGGREESTAKFLLLH
jgi:hypothetical protein